MKKLTAQTAQELITKVREVLEAADIEGVSLKLGTATWYETQITGKLTIELTDAPSQEAIELESMRQLLLECDNIDIDKVAVTGEKLVGYKSRNRRYPYLIEKNGKLYKINEDDAKRLFAAG